MSNSDQDKLIKEFKRKEFAEQLSHEAEIERTSVADKEGVTRANEGLRGLGQFLQEIEPTLAKAEYLGSAAVHYYHFPSIGQPVFVSQASTIGQTPEPLVQQGITDLRNELLQQYGHKPQRKRSGF